ncbi:hypothetical protein SLEP1_g21818 [Rubroshorea leprosula]|uniref:Diacylglycerol O-acyltransferase 3, cytosolic n=1 Tax=Rubroshorea leprosula TaxID=152421 RepID=A0AAV5JCN1_9ROSI|nr:hypothetical protein SLEP1_g21818 [Rubroshorea leprosula]
MEASRVVLRQILCVSGSVVDSHSRSSFSSSSSSSLKFETLSFSGKVKLRSDGFRDKGHMMYYNGSSRCGEKKEIKRKLKLLKGLSKDLSMFSNLGFAEDPQIQSSLVREDKGKIVKEATEVLLNQLEQLKAEEKELKRKRKEERAKLKEERKKTMVVCESSSSSSSSESSDGECSEVIDMSQLRNEESIAQPVLDESIPVIEAATTSILPILLPQEESVTKESGFEDGSHRNYEGQCWTAGPSASSCSNGSGVSYDEGSRSVRGASMKRIEVCMGKKCSKSGGAALLQEFERVVGVEGAVVGCKCLGKCRDGPNVRVLNSIDGIENEETDVSVRSMANNPLCLGVGLEDVQVIVANLFGKDGEALELSPAS